MIEIRTGIARETACSPGSLAALVKFLSRTCLDNGVHLRGLELLYRCWLLVGQRHDVGVGSGRKRLNILGAYSPDDHDYVDLRLTQENITGEQFIKLLEKLLAKHPETEKFILYLDNARSSSKPLVKEWLTRHRQFRLVFLPAYSPNLNLIERLWKGRLPEMSHAAIAPCCSED